MTELINYFLISMAGSILEGVILIVPVKVLLVVRMEITDAVYAHSLWANCPTPFGISPFAKS